MTLGILVLIIVCLFLLGNTMYVYLNSGALFDMNKIKNFWEFLTVIFNYLLVSSIIVFTIKFIFENWNVKI